MDTAQQKPEQKPEPKPEASSAHDKPDERGLSPDARQKKLAAALRKNLTRRKAQKRGRGQQSATDEEKR